LTRTLTEGKPTDISHAFTRFGNQANYAYKFSMVVCSFLMLHSSVTTGAGTSSCGEVFSPSVGRTTLPAIHRQVLLVWLLEDLVLWLIETERIKTFPPCRN
jgi:hypothetical protein